MVPEQVEVVDDVHGVCVAGGLKPCVEGEDVAESTMFTADGKEWGTDEDSFSGGVEELK